MQFVRRRLIVARLFQIVQQQVDVVSAIEATTLINSLVHVIHVKSRQLPVRPILNVLNSPIVAETPVTHSIGVIVILSSTTTTQAHKHVTYVKHYSQHAHCMAHRLVTFIHKI